MAWRHQNNSHPHGRTKSYYANHPLYPGAYQQPEAQTRTSRRIHDGFTINTNYGLDTVSDDVNSSPYSSPYYINGRYNSDNLTTQRGNSASVQGTKRFSSQKSLLREMISSLLRSLKLLSKCGRVNRLSSGFHSGRRLLAIRLS